MAAAAAVTTEEYEDDIDEHEEHLNKDRPDTDEELRAKIDLTEPEEGLQTHTRLDEGYVGSIEHLSSGHCVTSLMTHSFMQADNQKMVFSGFIAAAAEYAAIAAVNEPNVIMLACESNYLAPVRLGEELRFEARVKHNDMRKREINVIAFSNNVKVYIARISVVVTEYHPLKIRLQDVAKL